MHAFIGGDIEVKPALYLVLAIVKHIFIANILQPISEPLIS